MSAQLPEFVNQLVLDGTKVGWYQERIAAWQRGERIAPITIDCATTRACNAACHFCFAQMQASESEIPVSQKHFFDFLEDAAEIGVKGVSYISDGESTMSPWWPDAVEHGGSLGLAHGTSSNGIKLTREVLERVLPHLSYCRFNFSAGEKKRWAEIMGVRQSLFSRVVQNIKDGMEIIHRDGLSCSLNMAFVCDPRDRDQILPFARLVAELRPSYGIIKHCADDVLGTLGTDYTGYNDEFKGMLEQAEEIGRQAGVRITAKWSKLGGKRTYDRCFGPPFIMQMSGNGLVAPCGFLFNERYKEFHIGNITRERFRDIWASERFKEVMDYLASEHFDPRKRCGPNCLQHNTNNFLYEYVNGRVALPTAPPPPDLAFI